MILIKHAEYSSIPILAAIFYMMKSVTADGYTIVHGPHDEISKKDDALYVGISSVRYSEWMTPNVRSVILESVRASEMVALPLLFERCRLQKLLLLDLCEEALKDKDIKEIAPSISLEVLGFSQTRLTAKSISSLAIAKKITELQLDASFLKRCMRATVSFNNEISPSDQVFTQAIRTWSTASEFLDMVESFEWDSFNYTWSEEENKFNAEKSKQLRNYLVYGIFQNIVTIPGLRQLTLRGSIDRPSLQVIRQNLVGISVKVINVDLRFIPQDLDNIPDAISKRLQIYDAVLETVLSIYLRIEGIRDIVLNYLDDPAKLKIATKRNLLSELSVTPNVQKLDICYLNRVQETVMVTELPRLCPQLRVLSVKSLTSADFDDVDVEKMAPHISLNALKLPSHLTHLSIEHLSHARRITSLQLDYSQLKRFIAKTASFTKPLSEQVRNFIISYRGIDHFESERIAGIAQDFELEGGEDDRKERHAMAKEITACLAHGIFSQILKIPGLKRLELRGDSRNSVVTFERIKQNLPTIEVAALPSTI